MSNYSIKELDKIYKKLIRRINRFLTFSINSRISVNREALDRINNIKNDIKIDRKAFNRELSKQNQSEFVQNKVSRYIDVYEKRIIQITDIYKNELVAKKEKNNATTEEMSR